MRLNFAIGSAIHFETYKLPPVILPAESLNVRESASRLTRRSQMGAEMDNKKMSDGFETFLALALRTIGGFSIVCK